MAISSKRNHGFLIKSILIIIICLIIFYIIFPRLIRRPYTTIKGSESKDLLKDCFGTIIMEKPPGGLIAISLPDLSETVLRPSSGLEKGTVHSVSGPDADGRVAYVENHFFDADPGNRYHKLKVYYLKRNTEITLFRRSGDTIWEDVISNWLALSPQGGKIAFTSNNKHEQMSNPPVLLSVGDLEIRLINQKTSIRTGIKALNESFFNGNLWFPGGDTLAYVELIPKRHIAKALEDMPDVAAIVQNWEKIPTVCLFNVSRKQRTVIGPGSRPVVSADGKYILYRAQPLYVENPSWRLFEVQTGATKTVILPGAIRPYSLLEESKVIYYGLPTKGTKPKYTKSNSPIVGPKPMKALKIGTLDSLSFQTILPYIDPRHTISVSVIKDPNTII